MATTAGLTTLQLISTPGFYDNLEKKAQRLENGLLKKADEAGVPVQINRVGSMLTVFFHDQPVMDFADAARSDTARFARFWQSMLNSGIYLPPSAFEAWFVSSAHTDLDIDHTVRASGDAFLAVK